MDSNTTNGPSQPMQRVRGGDVFLQLGAFAALYASVGALLILLFRVIDAAFPPTLPSYSYLFSSNTISFQAATLIVFFPAYLVLSWVIQKTYIADPSRRDSRIRRGLIYLTLFISGFVMAGDLVYVIYSFLNGDNITGGFILKSLSVLVVLAGIFYYYVQDVRTRLTTQLRNMLRIFSIVLILGSLIMGFIVVGSPWTQKRQKLDAQRVSDLTNIQYQITNFYQMKGVLPNTMGDIADSLSYSGLPKDPETGASYEYVMTGPLAFDLCTTFSAAPPAQNVNAWPPAYYGGPNSNWQYQKGHYCFHRTIDPQLYPVRASAYQTYPATYPAVMPVTQTVPVKK